MPTQVMATTDHVLVALQARWGQQMIRRGGDVAVPPRLASGFASLDAMLSGGVPVGAVSHFVGRPTSGKTTIATAILAAACAEGAIAVFIDPAAQTDADYLIRMGLSLEDVLIVRTSLERSLDLLGDVAASGIPCAVALDLPNRLPPTQTRLFDQVFRRLALTLAGTRTFVLVLSSVAYIALIPARLRLTFSREAWLVSEGDVIGCCINVSIHHDRSGGSARQTQIDLVFPDSFALDVS